MVSHILRVSMAYQPQAEGGNRECASGYSDIERPCLHVKQLTQRLLVQHQPVLVQKVR